MFHKSTIAALFLVLATGCASTTPHNEYAPVATTSSGMKIRGELVGMTDVKIFVNGEKVIDEQLALLSGDGAFKGAYEGRHVLADCSSKAGMVQAKTRCVVSVAGEGSSALEF
jgi:hypothetical protein